MLLRVLCFVVACKSIPPCTPSAVPNVTNGSVSFVLIVGLPESLSTCNLAPGLAVPIPTLPELSIINLYAVPAVLSLIPKLFPKPPPVLLLPTYKPYSRPPVCVSVSYTHLTLPTSDLV